MISATEAKRISDRQSVIVDAYIEREIAPRVKAAAEVGELNCSVVIGSDTVYKIISPTPFETDVMWKLATLGYKVSLGRVGEEYVMFDEDNFSTTYKNYGYKISWK